MEEAIKTQTNLENLTLGKEQQSAIMPFRGDVMAKWFWEREDLYREDGKCAYAEQCSDYKSDCNPEECEKWESFFDGETQADEILSE